ncbi:hypothetical protein [Streptomyces sp. NPDC058755]|uniref:hypothetical protein n=1 Tax=Streptomyces sp. NPDC058755 TaxID=3346624 RepID=UPI00369C30A9
MSELTRLARDLIKSTYEEDVPRVPDLVRDFIEVITFAEPEDIHSALRDVLAEDWMAMPVWARNLAYRLACLQRPDDPELLRDAAADLLSFGPDWDDYAERLKARAAQLEDHRMRTDLALHQLEKALDRLTLDPERQIAHISRFGVGPDELALEFDDAFRTVSGMINEGRLPESLREPLDIMDSLLQEMTRTPEGKWTRDAILNSRDWNTLREFARNSLSALRKVRLEGDGCAPDF